MVNAVVLRAPARPPKGRAPLQAREVHERRAASRTPSAKTYDRHPDHRSCPTRQRARALCGACLQLRAWHDAGQSARARRRARRNDGRAARPRAGFAAGGGFRRRCTGPDRRLWSHARQRRIEPERARQGRRLGGREPADAATRSVLSRRDPGRGRGKGAHRRPAGDGAGGVDADADPGKQAAGR